MREKLIELLIDSPGLNTIYGTREEFAKNADYLIANGVTISKMETVATDNNVPNKWIPVSERLPDAWVDVLSYDRNKNLTVDCVDKKGKWYSEYKDLEEVTHWMPLPDPPKGE